MTRTRRIAIVTTLAAGLLGAVAVWAFTTGFAYYVLPPGLSGEADRLAALLELRPGVSVAEIGAGHGALTVDLARRVGPRGRVYSTELDPERRAAIERRVDAAGLRNVTVVQAAEAATNLPDACCAAVVMRNVYHHVGERAAFTASLRRAIASGGLVAVIDFEPGTLHHVGCGRGAGAAGPDGHGVWRGDLVAEATRAGFVLERDIPRWGGGMYLVLFRAGPAGAR